jgi:hypothetical protein
MISYIHLARKCAHHWMFAGMIRSRSMQSNAVSKQNEHQIKFFRNNILAGMRGRIAGMSAYYQTANLAYPTKR